MKNRTSQPKNDYPDHPRVAVGAVVFKENRVLLVRRGHPPAEDFWAIPGGSIEIGETLQQAAEREVREETGIQIRAAKPVYTFDVIERDESEGIRFHYVIVDLLADYVAGELSPGDDAVEARWVSVEEMNELPVSAATIKLLTSIFNWGL